MNRSVDKIRHFATGGLRFDELARRVWKEVNEDQVGNYAAELAYFFTLAFFPFLIFLIVLVSVSPGAPGLVLSYIGTLLPKEAGALVGEWVSAIFQRGTGTLLSVSLLLTLWSASTGVASLIDVFNVAYEVRERRTYWKYRLVALALTIGLSLLVLGGTLLFTFGSLLLDWLAGEFNLGETSIFLSRLINVTIGLGMLFLGVSMLHYFGPNVDQRWRFFSPGAVLTVAGIVGVSQLLSLYLRIAPRYDAIYGGLGAIIIFMLWQYLIGIILMVGAEVNDEVRKATGNRPRERVKR